MKTKQEIKNWLLGNCVNRYGDLDLSGLYFGDFDGDIYISDMQVKGDLYQYRQKVQGNLYQSHQVAQNDLHQDYQKVQRNLYQQNQNVQNDLYQNTQIVQGKLFQKFQKASKYYLQDTTNLTKERDYYVNKVKIKVSKEIYEDINDDLKYKYEVENNE